MGLTGQTRQPSIPMCQWHQHKEQQLKYRITWESPHLGGHCSQEHIGGDEPPEALVLEAKWLASLIGSTVDIQASRGGEWVSVMFVEVSNAE